jgi:pilus assembly protein CpaF
MRDQLHKQLTKEENEYLHLTPQEQQRVLSELATYGPLDTLIENPAITEIIINKNCEIWFEDQGTLHRHNDGFLTPVSQRNAYHRIFYEAQIELNIDQPFADGRWREFRIHAVAPPISGEVLICLRRHPKTSWTLEQLQANGWANGEEIKLIRKLIKEKATILVVGPTGTGKTSVLDACLQEVPPNERCLLIEDTTELHCPNAVSANLLTRRDPKRLLTEISQNELVKECLRMRPDRLIVGEIRGSEAKDLLMALSTGHKGSLSTLHADHPRQALIRLEMLVQLGSARWSLQAIRQLIFMSINYIIVTNRTPAGSRQLQGVFRLSSLEEAGITVEKISPNSPTQFGICP